MEKTTKKIIHVVHTQEIEIEFGKDGKPIEPKCPECASRVDRPKCFLELGGYCPRYPLLEAYRIAKADFRG